MIKKYFTLHHHRNSITTRSQRQNFPSLELDQITRAADTCFSQICNFNHMRSGFLILSIFKALTDN